MEGEIFVVTLVAIACATGLLKSWINRDKNKSGVDEESFNRLARAFMQHKKEMKKRVENLEAIISDQEDDTYSHAEIEAPKNQDTLTNDLQRSNKVQS